VAGLGLELLLELRRTADACRRHAAAAETVQNDGKLARSCRAGVMAIERENEADARWARTSLASRIGMLSPRIFSTLIIVVLAL